MIITISILSFVFILFSYFSCQRAIFARATRAHFIQIIVSRLYIFVKRNLGNKAIIFLITKNYLILGN